MATLVPKCVVPTTSMYPCAWGIVDQVKLAVGSTLSLLASASVHGPVNDAWLGATVKVTDWDRQTALSSV